MKSIIRLFRAVIIEKKKEKKPSKKLLLRTIKSGFILSGEVIANYSESELDGLITEVESLIGLTGMKMNSSFHKSWKKVKEANIEQLVIEQIIHYITTYGYERFGIYDEDTVFIPDEALNIPSLKLEKLSLVLIRGYTKIALKQKLLSLLNSGIALKEETIKDVLDVATYLSFDLSDLDSIRNREVKIALYDYLSLVPENPVELLRYLIFKATNKTLLIKDAATIEQIKGRNNIDILGIINRYSKAHGLNRLAEIFYRFKPLFLAFRTSSALRSTINKMRKLAVKNHRPMPEDYLNAVTGKIKQGKAISLQELKEELRKVNTFRKIRLAYALKYRTGDTDSILYKIRNGKGYSSVFEFFNKDVAAEILGTVIEAIAKDIAPNVSGKKIYIPDNVEYPLPATEKQFTGMFPSGTGISLSKDMIVGVYWENVDHHRIDLDLSLVNLEGKFGWDGLYRGEGGKILFSGDMTDAAQGASELFYVSRQHSGAYLVLLNYYNYDDKVSVPFKILVGHEAIKDFKAHYMVNPNNIVAITESIANQKQKVLGLLVVGNTGTKFFFSEINIGKTITSSSTSWAENARKYLLHYHQNMLTFKDVLVVAGAKLIKDSQKSDIDLSPGKLEKDALIKLINR